MTDYTCLPDDYLDARSATWPRDPAPGTWTPGHPWTDDEVLGRVRYDTARRLVVVAPTAVLVIHRLEALKIRSPR